MTNEQALLVLTMIIPIGQCVMKPVSLTSSFFQSRPYNLFTRDCERQNHASFH